VFIRIPALGNTDPANDWKPASDQGYEIQIDDTGKNPDVNPNVFNDPLHRTGAGAAPISNACYECFFRFPQVCLSLACTTLSTRTHS
jgi:hypothetical protein